MLIGIDATRAYKDQKTGTEYYSYNLIKYLTEIDKENQYILYANSQKSINNVELPFNFKFKILRFPRFWTQIRLSFEMLINQPDVLFVPAHTIPWIHPKNSVVTIHGLEYEYFPEGYGCFEKWYLRISTKSAVRWAKKIIVDSESTKKDLVKLYRADSEKIKVIYLGFQQRIKNKENKEQKIEDKKQGIKINKRPYILFVGRLEKRKNLVRLVKSFKKLKIKGIPHRLILAGKPGRDFKQIKKIIKKLDLEKEVKFTGYVSEVDLINLMKNADVFVYPSLYEGFGIPILESMSLGVPVVTSNISSMPEVAGDAAILVNPREVREIAKAIYKLIQDRDFRLEMIKKGFERVKKFSWDKCARDTIQVLKEAKSDRY